MSFDHLRRPLVSAAILVAFGLVSASAQDANKPADASPPAAQGASPSATEGVKSTNDQSGSSAVAPTSSQQQQGEKAVSTPSGKAGKEEPGSHISTQNAAVLIDGKLNVPGAPSDSQTVPAKFSPRNNAIDKLPIMAMSLGLSDAQKRTIVESVRGAGKPIANTQAKISEELPLNVVVHDLPASANDPAMAKLKYVSAQGRVLLIEPTNRVVIGEIAN